MTPPDPTPARAGQPAAAAAAAAQNPFPGLRPFREDEEPLFFGREAHVDRMVDALGATGFLAVVGSSGSGKSSLVSCGLVPALHRGLLARRPGGWRVAVCRPGNRPIRALAQALAEVLPRADGTAGGFSPAAMLEATLRASKRGLLDAWREAGLAGMGPPGRPEGETRSAQHAGTPVSGPNLLVVVDQFEELFRYRALGDDAAAGQAQAAEAVAFVNLLLEAAAQQALPLAVVITMRSDFLGECAQFHGLPEAINRGQFLVPRMGRDERRAAVRGPLAVCGAEIDPVLLNRLVNDVGDNPDQLSILQNALNRTWVRWRDDGASGPVAGTHYDAVGTMEAALDRHANEALGALTGPGQARLCEAVFRAITDRGTDARGIRRPTRLDTLVAITGADSAALEAVMAPFRDPDRAFLMPPAGVALEPATPIDISHESLMRVWTQLRRWTDAEAMSARIYRRLVESATLHADGDANLLGPPELQVALAWQGREQPNAAWAGRYSPGFDTAMAFLDASRQDFEARQAAEQARLRAEAEAEQLDLKRLINKRWWQVVLPAALLLCGVLAWKWHDAVQQADLAAASAREAQAANDAASARALDDARWAVAELRSVRDELARQQQAVAELAQTAPGAAAKLRNQELLVQTRPLVYLQFADERQRAALQALLPQLKQAGYEAPGMEKVRSVPRQTELRYFRTDDADAAAALARQFTQWGQGPVATKLAQGYTGTVKRQQFELWLALPAASDQVSQLAQALNAPDKQARLDAVRALKAGYAGSPDAVAAVLALLAPDSIGNLSSEGRFNAVFVLAATTPAAWTPGLVQTAQEALARIDERGRYGMAVGEQTLAEMQHLRRLLAQLPVQLPAQPPATRN